MADADGAGVDGGRAGVGEMVVGRGDQWICSESASSSIDTIMGLPLQPLWFVFHNGVYSAARVVIGRYASRDL